MDVEDVDASAPMPEATATEAGETREATGAAGAADTALASRAAPTSTVIRVAPIWKVSPVRKLAWLIGCPLTFVPEPRSMIWTSSGLASMTACMRATPSSSIRRWDF